MKHATELTTLTGGTCKNNYKSCLLHDDRYLHCNSVIKDIWFETSSYFWKLLTFLVILVLIHTILESILVKETNLIFKSSISNNNIDLNSNNYGISNEEIEANIIWINIATDLHLNKNKEYLNKWIKQGILINHGTSDINKYEFISRNYEIHELYDDDIMNLDANIVLSRAPSLIYITLEKSESNLYYLSQMINDVHDMNLILLLNSAQFSLLYGPRIPNKKRGTKSEIDSVDWTSTLLQLDDGYNLWQTITH